MSDFILYAGVAALIVGLLSLPLWVTFVISVVGVVYATL